ncbi:MAG: CopG family transcriptional regulator [Actinomycetota bacterium]|nr:CopG family transcriptional regulator [Actinomycetota bacterium]
MTEKRTYGRTNDGVELTLNDELLQRMAEEAGAGLDVPKLRRRPGRPPMGSGPAETLPVRFEPELRKALDDRAATDHTTASAVVGRPSIATSR